MRFAFHLTSALALAASATAATGANDPVGDFLPTYTGPTNSDVDLTSGNVALAGSNFLFSVSTNGTPGTTPNSLYIWAINRGAGIARPTLSPPDGASLLWDAVVVMVPDGSLRVVTFPAAGAPSLVPIPGGTSVSGNSLYATVSGALLPSTGFTPDNYTFSLWSRVRLDPTKDGVNSEIPDFLAGSPFKAAVPEPATWLMMLLGFAGMGWVVRTPRRLPPQLA